MITEQTQRDIEQLILQNKLIDPAKLDESKIEAAK
jgi:hypothetical protein